MLSSKSRATTTRPSLLHELVVLFKLRIVVLLLLAALAGQLVAAGGWPGWQAILLLIAAGGSAAGGASALNEYLERDRDARMVRTTKRPLVSGTVSPSLWLVTLALAMVLLPVLLLYPLNPEFSAWLLLGAIIYVLVYTVWLKPRTPLNIVIGGAAGSCAVISGAASVGMWDDPGALLLALLLFCWTPIHFWSLAIVYAQDYKRARIPMLPVTSSPQVAAAWGLVHGIGAAFSGLVLALVPGLGPVYAIPAAGATAALLWQGWLLVQDASPKRAWRLFHTSNLYLFVTLIALCLASVLRVPWP